MRERFAWKAGREKARYFIWNSRWSERERLFMSEAAVLPRRTSPLETLTPGTILIIDDEAAIRESLETLLDLEGYAVRSAENGQEGLARIAERPFDLVLLDFAMPDVNGIDLLREIRERDPQLSVIMITAYGTVENAVKAMQAGAVNFIQKPWDNEKLIAEAIHMNSPRKERAFVPVNTGSMPTDLLESTLFGHVKGAFTSAIASKKGLFEVADRGTIFLDEIGTMNLETQSKILRVLQDRKFMHLGGVQEVQVDVRIIAATNVDLRQAVREGKFREDLYYRLNVITVDLPPLRERKEDIPLLAAHFI